MKGILILLIAAHIALLNADDSAAEWVLYDDFNSGAIDDSRWLVDDSSATISIENGELKFVHHPGYPLDFSMLIFKRCPEQITGIKVKVRVQTCTGDVSTRTGGFVAEDEYAGFVWQNMRLDPQSNSIHCYVHTMAPNSYTWNRGLIDEFIHFPASVLGKDVVIEQHFQLNQSTFAVDNLATITFEPGVALFPPTLEFEKHIGTKSDSGDGPCVVYFDDVYIERDGVCGM